jgi:hypothetical protein
MPNATPAAYVIKAAIQDLNAACYAFAAQKTMYGGKLIAAGDVIFLFASENEGGRGLFARGINTSASNTPKNPDLERQTPRVSIKINQLEKPKNPSAAPNCNPSATGTMVSRKLN